MTQETKPERQSVEEIANSIILASTINDMGETKLHFTIIKAKIKTALVNERSISDKLREENEALKKRVDSEYDRGIADASKFVEELNALSTGYIAVAILRLRRGDGK